jgi:hypothetical protein
MWPMAPLGPFARSTPMTSNRPTCIERAFELANSGACAGVQDIRKQLRAEGYAETQLYGSALSRQLRDLCLAASKRGAAE